MSSDEPDCGAITGSSVSPAIGAMLALLLLVTHGAFALEWQIAPGGWKFAPLAVPALGTHGFVEMSPLVTKIHFTNRLSEERSLTNQIYLNGSGVAAGDYDGDGRCDLYFCGLDNANALYRNLGGWRFEEVAALAGVACADQASTGAAFADVDGDGDLDLLVNGVGRGTRLFLYDQGKFAEATDTSGLKSSAGSGSLALADIDGDGLLDIYQVNYRVDTMRDMPALRFRVGVTNGVYQLLSVNDRSVTAPHLAGRYSIENSSSVLENGEPDVLYKNLGGGKFAAVPWNSPAFIDEKGTPVPAPFDWGLSAMFHDLNGDGAPDLYVCNDFQSPDRVWMNDGRGNFRALSHEALPHTSLFSMGVDFSDIDRDGNDDFFVADMRSRERLKRQVQVMDSRAYAQARAGRGERAQVPHNTLFLGRSQGIYAEIAQFSGVDASDWSWCPAFVDVDLDGFEDLLITTGHERDLQNADVARAIEEEKKRRRLTFAEELRLRKQFPRLDTPNAAFRNRGDLTFEDVSERWRFASQRISHGMALADLDGDGDLDAVVNCLNDGPLLCRNDSARPRLAVRLRGAAPNTRAVGARLQVTAPGLPAQTAEIKCGGRYLSSDDFSKVFACGDSGQALSVQVTWRNGSRTLLTNIAPNQIVEISEQPGALASNQAARASAKSGSTAPFFEDCSHLLNHIHQDEPFDDFSSQPLLPHKLSAFGPGVTWFDFNTDGWDDLFIGAGRGGRLAVYRNDGKGGFIRQKAKMLDGVAAREMTTVLGWQRDGSDIQLLLGQSTVAEGPEASLAVKALSIVTGTEMMLTNEVPGSVGPLVMGDLDADGDLDLFVGGRLIPSQYPEAASSAIFRNADGQLRVDSEASRLVSKVGLVSGAAYSDLTGDGWPELVLACEWGPIRIFRNERGRLQEWDLPLTFQPGHSPGRGSDLRLSGYTGWWTTLATGDFDGDGNLDVVAGNWGQNTARRRFSEKPISLFYSRVSNSAMAMFEAHYDPGLQAMVPAHDLGSICPVFPALRERFDSFTKFSAAPLSEVLVGLPPLEELRARAFETVLLLNRTNFFEVRPLPAEAHFSPVLGIAAGDLDGDGSEDLFLAQNFYGMHPSETRQDAGVGLWLRGDGKGGFAPAPAGVVIRGEGRGIALADFDQDGRLDLAMGTYNGPTRLLRNRSAVPGVQVLLEGPGQNRQAAGAVVRARYKNGQRGPAREIRLGTGHWSQDSTRLILPAPLEIESLEVRWLGGRVDRIPAPPNSRAISAKF